MPRPGDDKAGAPQCLLPALALVALVGAWLHRQLTEFSDVMSPELTGLMCIAGTECLPQPLVGYDMVPWSYAATGWLENMMPEAIQQQRRQFERFFERLQASAALPAVLHIGANELANGLTTHLHQSWAHRQYRAVLVEPENSTLATLREALLGAAGPPDVVSAVVALGTDVEVPFYTVSNRISEDMPLLQHMHAHLMKFRSTSKEDLEAALLRECRSVHWLTNCALWRSYVAETRARRLAPGELLREAGVEATSALALLLDAQGGDAALAGAFMELDNFRPAIVLFKHTQEPFAEVSRLVRALAAKGYDVWMSGLYIFAVLAD